MTNSDVSLFYYTSTGRYDFHIKTVSFSMTAAPTDAPEISAAHAPDWQNQEFPVPDIPSFPVRQSYLPAP